MTAQFDFWLPMPPSLNNAYENFQARSKKTGKMVTRRRKSDEYDAWKNTAIGCILQAVAADRRIAGPVCVAIALPEKMRGDVDNRIKPILDALVKSGRIDDDRNVIEVSAGKRLMGANRAFVSVSASTMRVAA